MGACRLIGGAASRLTAAAQRVGRAVGAVPPDSRCVCVCVEHMCGRGATPPDLRQIGCRHMWKREGSRRDKGGGELSCQAAGSRDGGGG